MGLFSWLGIGAGACRSIKEAAEPTLTVKQAQAQLFKGKDIEERVLMKLSMNFMMDYDELVKCEEMGYTPTKQCASCGTMVSYNDKRCYHCGGTEWKWNG